MKSSTTVEVALRDDGVSAVTVMRCEAPLLVRQDTADGVLTLWLVGGAAGPLGGDELSLRVVVGPGASVRVRSVAAMLAQPGVSGGSSELRTHVDVGEGAALDWDPEPIISVRGSDHRSTTLLTAAPTSTVRFADAASLGRHDEDPGLLTLHQRVTVAGHPVLDHALVLGTAPHVAPDVTRANAAFRESAGDRVPGAALIRVRAAARDRVPGAALDRVRAAARDRVPGAARDVADTEALHGPGAHGPLRLVRSVVTLGPDAAITPSATVTKESLDATYPLAPNASLTLTTRT